MYDIMSVKILHAYARVKLESLVAIRNASCFTSFAILEFLPAGGDADTMICATHTHKLPNQTYQKCTPKRTSHDDDNANQQQQQQRHN